MNDETCDPRKIAAKRGGLSKVIEQKRNVMPEVLAHLAKGAQLFYGTSQTDPAPVKKMIEALLFFTPEMWHFLSITQSDVLIDNVEKFIVDALFKSGEEGLKGIGAAR